MALAPEGLSAMNMLTVLIAFVLCVLVSLLAAYVGEVQYRMNMLGCSLREALLLRPPSVPKCCGRVSTHSNDGAYTETTVTYYDTEECP